MRAGDDTDVGPSPPSSWRKPGPITPKAHRCAMLGPRSFLQSGAVVVGPGFRQDDDAWTWRPRTRERTSLRIDCASPTNIARMRSLFTENLDVPTLRRRTFRPDLPTIFPRRRGMHRRRPRLCAADLRQGDKAAAEAAERAGAGCRARPAGEGQSPLC